MKNVLLPNAIKLNKDRKQRTWWQRMVRVVAMAVVFCTTYALILPAITMEGEPACGVEAHTHTEACFTEKPVMVYGCGLEVDLHTHTDTCCQQTLSPVCEYVHIHSDSCAAVTRPVLTCTLEESQGHTHSEACAVTEQTLICTLPETAPHIHGEGCTVMEEQLLCTLAEGEAHAHTAECFTIRTKTVCTLPEGEGHTHGNGCYETKRVNCSESESEGHTHGNGCYEDQLVPCDLTTNDGHVHEESCYAAVDALVCTIPEEAPHVHVESCLQETGEMELVLTCELTEHIHDERCYALEDENDQSEYLCGMGVHVHTSDCIDADGNVICTIPEHDHVVSCLVEDVDLTADVENEEKWQEMFSDLTLTGVWAQDVLTVAQTQLGYQESAKNVTLDGLRVKGYTRYGAKYGDPYGDWNAMFVSFCLEYAGVTNFPLNTDCTEWVEALEGRELFVPAGEHQPKAGDLVFFGKDLRGEADGALSVSSVGIVARLIAGEGEEPAKIQTIQGDVKNAVSYVTVQSDDSSILGYAILQEPDPVCELQEHTHSDGCVDEGLNRICGMVEHTHNEECGLNDQEMQTEPELVGVTLICTLTEHTHGEECCDPETGDMLCVEVEHVHSRECCEPARASFLYEDENVIVEVSVVSYTGLPAGMTMRVTGLSPEEFTTYESYAQENAQGELFEVTGYQIHFYLNGAEIELEDAEVTAHLTIHPVEYKRTAAQPASEPVTLELEEGELILASTTIRSEAVNEITASEEIAETVAEEAADAAGEDSAEDRTVLVTVLQQDEMDVSKSGTATFSGDTAQGTELTLTMDVSRSFALANQAVANPEFSVEYYAHFPKMQYSTTEEKLSLDVIDTRGNGDGKGGSLPVNGKGRNNSPTDNPLLYLLLEETTRKTTQMESGWKPTGKSEYIYKVMTKTTLLEVYNKTDYTYYSGMNILNVDKLHLNDHYILAEFWVKNEDDETWTVYTQDETNWVQDTSTGLWTQYAQDTAGNDYAVSEEKITTLVVEPELHDIVFSNNAEDSEKITIRNGETVRLVYDLKSGNFDVSANLFDYDISDTKAYLYNSSKSTYDSYDSVTKAKAKIQNYRTTNIYMMTSAYGINSVDAYLGDRTTFSDNELYFAFGNQNTGVTHRYDSLNGYYINGGNSGNNPSGAASYKTCSFGLVKTLLRDSSGNLTTVLDYADGIVHQALFNDETYYGVTVPGKTTYARQTLNFTRTGDTYILTAVNDGSNSVISENQLNEFILPGYAYATTDPQFANNFWPLDGVVEDSTEGRDFKFGYYAETYNRRYVGDGSASYFPDSDDGNAHNSYFGMQFAVKFELDGDYCGPLEYLFYGDDDMWVFLTNDDTDTVQQICDIGGVHGSVGSFTDLWDYIPKGEEGKGNYTLNFYYTERGATGSSCYMEFTLPAMASVPQNIPETGSVSVTKEVSEGASAEGEDFTFLFELEGSSDNFAYEIRDINNVTVSSSNATLKTGDTFTLRAGQTILIVGIPKNSVYTITELLSDSQAKDYTLTWVGSSDPESDSVSGTIVNGVTHSYTCLNEALGVLEVEKVVSGTATTDAFKVDVTLTDAGGNPLSGTFGETEFVSGKATVELAHGEKVSFTDLPVGTLWTVEEHKPDGFNVSYLLGNQTLYQEDGKLATLATGTIVHKSAAAVQIVNTTHYELPETGGSGTSHVTFGGLYLFTAACVYLMFIIGRKYRKGGMVRDS